MKMGVHELPFVKILALILPSRFSGRGYKIGPVRLLVTSLLAEAVDLGLRNLVWRMTLITSWPSLKIKVKGQGRHVEKHYFRTFEWCDLC